MPAQSKGSLEKSNQWIECRVLGIFVHPTRNTPIVFVGTEDESVVIPIWIGFLEAQAILFAWKHVPAPRPLTADLLTALVTEDLKAKIDHIEIQTIKDGIYFANIVLATLIGDTISRDARPSDALAVALRANAPIQISRAVIEATQSESDNAKALLDFLRLESEDNAENADK